MLRNHCWNFFPIIDMLMRDERMVDLHIGLQRVTRNTFGDCSIEHVESDADIPIYLRTSG
jgi:hypothetical protein